MGRYLGTKVRKTKRYSREADQVLHEDMSSAASIHKLSNQEIDEEKPGLAQFYCIPCARHCETEHAFLSHVRGKVHKRRLRDLRDGPYTSEEADMAAGKDIAKYLAKKEKEKLLKIDPKVHELLTPVRKGKDIDTEMKEETEGAAESESKEQSEQKNADEEEPLIE